MKELLTKIKNGHSLNFQEMQHAMSLMLESETSEACIGALLMGLSQKGESSAEIAGAAAFLREQATPIAAPEGTVDCCGTGGDLKGTYNISTASALVTAACGVPVAKHGNKSASSKSGAADVLEELGVPLNVEKTVLEGALRDLNFCFLMAPYHHYVLKPIVPIRKNLGIPTIFNLLGPLANPADTKIQLIGVYDRKWLRPMAEALKQLGTKRAWLVHGKDGLDEVTLTSETYIVALDDDGHISERILTPSNFGLPYCKIEDIKGGSPQRNASALRDLLDGKQSAYRSIVLANAASVVYLQGQATNLNDAVKQCTAAIDEGKAKAVLENYIEYVKKGSA